MTQYKFPGQRKKISKTEEKLCNINVKLLSKTCYTDCKVILDDGENDLQKVSNTICKH